MPGFKSPIETAYQNALSNRLLSMVYAALNAGVLPEGRKSFRKDWIERGSYRLGELLLHCASPDWTSYAETFWIDPWIGKHLIAHCGGAESPDPGNLCYIIDEWLDNQPLPSHVSEDPLVEDDKLKELKKLFLALNR
jgi:hypothetical protein